MNMGFAAFQIVSFSLAWWLGLYLLGRDITNPQLRFTGLGLVTYSLALAADLLLNFIADPIQAGIFLRWSWPFILMPAIFWFGSILYLIPESAGWSQKAGAMVNRWLIPLAIVVFVVAGSTGIFGAISADGLRPNFAYLVFVTTFFILLLGSILLLLRILNSQQNRLPIGLILVASLFFGLGFSLLLVPLEIIPRQWLIMGIGFDLALLGFGIAMTDALNQGEALLPDIVRSLAYSFLIIILFGGQVILAMAFSTGATLAMVTLLLAVIMTASVIQTFSDSIQAGLDWLIFGRISRIRETRQEARIVAKAASRSRDVLDPASLTEKQFVRLTRQALSQMGNLPRLSASPLTRLHLIERRLHERRRDDNTLERAAELKLVLAESIDRLKPRGEAEFGMTDEWRFYNALYFPYVAGIKPYNRRVDSEALDTVSMQVLEWFRMQVPERTLHNWQNAAAKLVAQDILEQAGRQDPAIVKSPIHELAE